MRSDTDHVKLAVHSCIHTCTHTAKKSMSVGLRASLTIHTGRDADCATMLQKKCGSRSRFSSPHAIMFCLKGTKRMKQSNTTKLGTSIVDSATFKSTAKKKRIHTCTSPCKVKPRAARQATDCVPAKPQRKIVKTQNRSIQSS